MKLTTRISRLSTAVILALMTSSQAPSQGSLSRIDSDVPQNAFGSCVRAAGDVNGDGTPDFLVGSFRSQPIGRAHVFSGLDGSEIHTLSEPGAFFFGFALAGMGDIDGDGFGDFAVGAPLDSHVGFRQGRVYVYSGRDAALLYFIDGPRVEARFGSQIAPMGDLDGDGIVDLAVGAPTGALGAYRGHGSVMLYSGATGTLIRSFEGPFHDSRYGDVVCSAGDFDGDGRNDLLLGAPRERGQLGAVRVLSSANGSVLFEWMDTIYAQNVGKEVAAMPDVDGDGIPEVLIGLRQTHKLEARSGSTGSILWEVDSVAVYGPQIELFEDRDGDGVIDFLFPEGRTFVQVRSGATGEVLESSLRATPFGTDELQKQIAVLGDVNQDGYPDYAVGARGQIDPMLGSHVRVGTVYVFSGGPSIDRVICSNGDSAPQLMAQGSLDPTDNRVTLTLTRLREPSVGFFLTSLGAGTLVQPGGAENDLCIVDPVAGIGRHLDSPTDIVRDHSLQIDPDLSSLPSPMGAVQALAGQTRYWQYWGRRTNPQGNSISFFSNAIAVDFR